MNVVILLLISVLYSCNSTALGEVGSAVLATNDKSMQKEAKPLTLALEKCEKKYKDIDSNMLCQMQVFEHFANNDNFLAQEMMGQISLIKKNKEEAIKWFQASIDHPRSPKAFKEQVKAHIEKL